jgi:adenosylhomocysteine nucleosidase
LDAALKEAAEPLTLACALAVEEGAARSGGARAARVGLQAGLPLPEGPLVSFGLAGALVPGLEPGTLLTARRVVDADGTVLWEDEPLRVPGALTAVVCDAGFVVDDPVERRELARRTGAAAADMESAALAATGRLAGVVRAISDTPERPVGRLAHAAVADGGTAWGVVARALLAEPRTTVGAARSARRALSSLRHAAVALAPGGTA